MPAMAVAPLAVTEPVTERAEAGAAVPIPTLPDSTTNAAALVMVALVPATGAPEMDNVAALVIVELPTNP
jgi:hypothetical protein